MAARLSAVAAAVCALTAAAVAAPTAHAQDTLDDLDAGAKVHGPAMPSASAPAAEQKAGPEVNGYLRDRLSFSHIDTSSLVPAGDIPSLLEMIEGNVQLRMPLGDRRYFAYADASVVAQAGSLFHRSTSTSPDAGAGTSWTSDHDIPALHPAFVPSELYVSASPKQWLTLLAGKKRIVWGSGLAFNPTDLLNPPKDPTDPNLQRAGNWIARVELPFERLTFTALLAPAALYTEAGLPYAMLRYPSYRPAGHTTVHDDNSHYLAAARVYALLFDADVSLMYFFSNQFQDAFARKSRFGVSFSRYFFTDYELHLEALLGTGSARAFACAVPAPECAAGPAFVQTKLDSSTWYPRVLVGTRRMFADESMLSVEYYYQGDGYTDREFADAVELMSSPAANSTTGSDRGAALPQRFSFEPMRRHYLIASYSKPRIFDDWTLGAVLIGGLRDLSGVFSPSVSWSAREWLALSLYGYLPIRGLGVGEASAGGRQVSEYSLMPVDYRALFEARLYY